MRVPFARVFALCLALAALAAACSNKALGTETTGRDGTGAKGYRITIVPPAERRAAPRFQGKGLDGAPISFRDYRGSVTVVNVWGAWCVPCRIEQPVLERVWRAYRDRGVKFLGIDIREPSLTNAQVFIDEFDVTYPSIFSPDSAVAAMFRIRTPPATFVLDREGRVAARIFGATTKDEELSTVIDRVLAS